MHFPEVICLFFRYTDTRQIVELYWLCGQPRLDIAVIMIRMPHSHCLTETAPSFNEAHGGEGSLALTRCTGGWEFGANEVQGGGGGLALTRRTRGGGGANEARGGGLALTRRTGGGGGVGANEAHGGGVWR